ncbi:hypothetical protein GCM10009076_25130 [Erythrobacter ramosus]
MAALGAKKGVTQGPQRGSTSLSRKREGDKTSKSSPKGEGDHPGPDPGSWRGEQASPPINNPYKVLPIAVRIVSNTSDSVSPSD